MDIEEEVQTIREALRSAIHAQRRDMGQYTLRLKVLPIVAAKILATEGWGGANITIAHELPHGITWFGVHVVPSHDEEGWRIEKVEEHV